jgi:hypothetical protein
MGDIFLINQSEPRKKKMKDKNFGMAPNNKNIPAILLLSYKPLINNKKEYKLCCNIFAAIGQ